MTEYKEQFKEDKYWQEYVPYQLLTSHVTYHYPLRDLWHYGRYFRCIFHLGQDPWANFWNRVKSKIHFLPSNRTRHIPIIIYTNVGRHIMFSTPNFAYRFHSNYKIHILYYLKLHIPLRYKGRTSFNHTCIRTKQWALL